VHWSFGKKIGDKSLVFTSALFGEDCVQEQDATERKSLVDFNRRHLSLRAALVGSNRDAVRAPPPNICTPGGNQLHGHREASAVRLFDFSLATIEPVGNGLDSGAMLISMQSNLGSVGFGLVRTKTPLFVSLSAQNSSINTNSSNCVNAIATCCWPAKSATAAR
jgi:hypothetical protein